jgi:hypothetical protein
MPWRPAKMGLPRAILTEYECSHPQTGYAYVSLLDEGSMPAVGSRTNG